MENRWSSLAGGKVYVDYVYVAESTCILGGAAQDTQFVKISCEPAYCCRVPLTRLAFLLATRSPFICLV